MSLRKAKINSVMFWLFVFSFSTAQSQKSSKSKSDSEKTALWLNTPAILLGLGTAGALLVTANEIDKEKEIEIPVDYIIKIC